jgi:hypothetical protein
MDDFSYLSVLISVVLGLGITNLLAGFAALVRNRGRVKIYWPMPMWMITLFLIHIQTWWAMFGLRGIRAWNFGAFLIVLMQPVGLFVMTALIAPDSTLSAEVADTKAAYFRESRWFFAVLLLVLGDSVAKNLVLYGSAPEPSNLAAHFIFSGAALAGLLLQRDNVHKVLAPLGLALIVGYIALLFTRLPANG